MSDSKVCNGFIIDLSATQNTTQLVFELSSIMEHPDVQGKNILLKLGSIDLKQSQLLSIKALIEAMDAKIASINTDSDQTEAAAISLDIAVNKNVEFNNDEKEEYIAQASNAEEESVVVKEEKEEEENTSLNQTESLENKEAVEQDSFEVFPENSNLNSEIINSDNVEDTYDEESMQEISEIIPVDNFETDFEKLAKNEGLISPNEISKYILLDTGNVIDEDIEKNSINTKTLSTLYISQTLRSGQTITHDGNILIIGDAHPGSEIIAGGDITVWGILGGIAHAGKNGNVTAKVRALKLNAIQLRIAGLYARRNDTLNVPYVQKSNEFTPEEAQIEDGKIVIYKKLRRD